jgi:hypothetical protein
VKTRAEKVAGCCDRLDLGLLPREVAEQIVADKTPIYHWERQVNTPGMRFIARIIEFLGYDLFKGAPVNVE